MTVNHRCFFAALEPELVREAEHLFKSFNAGMSK